MKFFTLPALFVAALFSAIVVVPFLPVAQSSSGLFVLEARLASTTTGYVQLYYDSGAGLSEGASTRLPLPRGVTTALYRLPVPTGTYRAFRFDPIDRDGTVTIKSVRLVGPGGRVVRPIALSELKPIHQIDSARESAGGLEVVVTPGTNDPQLFVEFTPPLVVEATFSDLVAGFLPRALGVFAALAALLFTLDRATGLWRAFDGAGGWLAARPGRAVALAAAFAVVASSYPVVFLGKSFVSPNFGTVLLYEAFPTLPGYRDARIEEVKAADVGAVMWAHIPLSVLESRAVLRDHALPLWNRYNSAGTPLLGQGQSMFGDPLHVLVVAANGAAWAWDLKYLVAKWLLAAGIGLCVLRATRHLPAAAIVATVMPFIGYFVYRVNHPAIFSLCYAPWILWCWLGIVTAEHWRTAAGWVGGLLLANWAEMNSGTVKEAYMSLLTLNAAGVVALLVAALPLRERARRLGLAVAGGAIFALLAAPVWLTFLDALAKSYTGYNDPRAYQVQPSLALAFFDEILFRPFNESEKVYNGSVNFVVLLGVLAFLVNLRRICADRLALGLALATLPPLALIFGVVPPSWIVRVPFLGNVAHIDNSFFCPTVTLLGVLAGYGFRAAAQRLGRPEGRGDLALGGVLLAGLAAHYVAFGQTVQRSTYSYWHWGEQIARSPFVVVSLVGLLAAAVGLALLARGMLVRRAAGPASVLALATCVVLLLWRHGLQAQPGFAGYALAPPSRVDFHAASPALAAAREDRHGEPWRFVGLNGNAFHGWMNVYEFEGICGPDALVNAQYRELQDALGLERIWDWRIYAQYPTLAAQKRAFDFLNVRHYFDYHSDQALLGALLTPVKMADLDVYRSETAWPRAFFTDRIAVYDDASALGKLVNGGDGRPFAAMQRGDTTRPGILFNELDHRTVVPAKDYQLTGNTTAFDVEATGPGVVVLHEAWLRKDFRARVDGKPVPYLRVNHAFKGVVVDSAGRHHIEFEYWPRRFTDSLAMSGAGFALLLGAVWFVRRTAPATQ